MQKRLRLQFIRLWSFSLIGVLWLGYPCWGVLVGFPLVRLYGFVALALAWHYRASTAAYSGFLASGGYVDCYGESWLTGAYSGSGLFPKSWDWSMGFVWLWERGIILWENCLLRLIFC